MRRRFPTWSAMAWVFSSWAWPAHIANSPSKAMTLGDPGGAPMKSQNAALPAAVAMPMPEGPPLTSFVTSVDSMCPDSERMPRPFAWANSAWSASPWSASRVLSAPAPRRKPSASTDSIASSGATR